MKKSYSGVPDSKAEGMAKARHGADLLQGRYAEMNQKARMEIGADHWKANLKSKPYPGGFDALWNSKRSQ